MLKDHVYQFAREKNIDLEKQINDPTKASKYISIISRNEGRPWDA